jgi:ABC-type nickel/cobalt efflux system permease component RcnA
MIGRWGPHDVGGSKHAAGSTARHHHDDDEHHAHHHHDHDHDHDDDDGHVLTDKDRAERPLELWEKRVDAVENLIGALPCSPLTLLLPVHRPSS